MKIGEHIGIQAGIQEIPSTVCSILADPLNLQEGSVKHKFFRRKTKAAAHKTEHQHKTVINASRLEGS